MNLARLTPAQRKARHAAQKRRWQQQNAEKHRQATKAWRNNNRAKARELSKAWNAAHPEKIAAARTKLLTRHPGYERRRYVSTKIRKAFRTFAAACAASRARRAQVQA